MILGEFINYNKRTLTMKFDEAFFNKFNFKFDKDTKNIIINLCLDELRKEDINKPIDYSYLNMIASKVLNYYLSNNINNTSFVCKFIESNFQFTDNYYQAVISLNKLILFLELSEVRVSERFLAELFKQSNVLRQNLNLVVNTKKDDISAGKIGSVFKNDLMLLFIDVYLFMYPYGKQENFDLEIVKKMRKTNIEIKPQKTIKEPSLPKRKNKVVKNNFSSKCREVDTYYSLISKFSSLSFNEEQELSRRVSLGDKKARDKLINCNLELAFNIALEYVETGIEFSDLIQEANLGLIKAVEKYDSNRGSRFSNVAEWWIRQTIISAIENKNNASLFCKNAEANKYRKARSSLILVLGHEPTYQEISDILDLSLEEVEYYESLINNRVSLNISCNDDEINKLFDYIGKDSIDSFKEDLLEERKKELLVLIDSEDLNMLEKQILIRHFGFYGEYESFASIGRSFNLSENKVRTRFNIAIKKIINGKNIEEYSKYRDKNYIKK